MQSNNASYGDAWNPAGTEIAYTVSVGGSNTDIYETPTGGGTAVDVTPSFLRNTGMLAIPSWNADGTTLAATYTPSGGGVSQVMRFSTTYSGGSVTLTPEGDSDKDPSLSPDGSKIVLYRGSNNSATAGIYVSDANGGNQTLLLADPTNNVNSIIGLAWSPFLPKETVVAASGSTFYHAAASGFLLSQVGDQFGSVVAFTAVTPSAATIQAPSTNGGTAPMQFTLTADSITEVGYTNSYFSPGTTITLASTPTVLVSVDAVTGQVDVVAPAATPQATPVKNSDGTVSYRCSFTAIYDGAGKNLAPSGASQVVVNPKTGKLISFK